MKWMSVVASFILLDDIISYGLWQKKQSKQWIDSHWKLHNFKFQLESCVTHRAHCTLCNVVSHLLQWQVAECGNHHHHHQQQHCYFIKESTQNWQQMKLIMHTAISIESMWWKFAMHEMENGCVGAATTTTVALAAASSPPSLVLVRVFSIWGKETRNSNTLTQREIVALIKMCLDPFYLIHILSALKRMSRTICGMTIQKWKEMRIKVSSKSAFYCWNLWPTTFWMLCLKYFLITKERCIRYVNIIIIFSINLLDHLPTLKI